jgi:uncharacterized protein (DUF433 family)
MHIEEYFDFLSDNDIRIKGSRIGIETILYEFIHRNRTPEDIIHSYPSLSLEQVYAAILYYLHNKQQVGKYVADWLEQQHQRQLEQESNPHAGIVRLREVVAEYGRNPLVYKDLRGKQNLATKMPIPLGER